jgi:hypothetical protein
MRRRLPAHPWPAQGREQPQAANFCDLIQGSSDAHVATELENVRTSLFGVADSLASHFGDWGALSRFAAPDPPRRAQRPGTP